jgi:excisionase family DNA binding protein
VTAKQASPYRLFSVRELAALLGVRDDTVRDLVDRGELHSKVVGNRRRVPAYAVEEWLRRDGKKGRAA